MFTKSGEQVGEFDVPRNDYLRGLKPIDARNVNKILARLRKIGRRVGGRIIATSSSLTEPDYNAINLRTLVEWVGNEQHVNERVVEAIERTEQFSFQHIEGEPNPPGPPDPDRLLLTSQHGGSPIDIILLMPQGFTATGVERILESQSVPYSELCKF